MNEGTLFRAHAIKNVFGGDAISRVAGEVVFTPGVIANEDFIGRIVRVSKDYARAELVEITNSSPERITCSCPGMGRCPGCVYGHCSHAEEQNQKLNQLRDFMKQLNIDPELVQGQNLENAPTEFYRNKIKLTMRKAGGEAQLGYVFSDGRMYHLTQCRLASSAINRKLSELLAAPGFIPSMHDRMTLTLRESADGVSYFRNSPGKRASLLREKVMGRDFQVPPDGFFQVNQHGLDTLCTLVAEFLQTSDCEHFIDAYAGSGLFGAVAASTGVKTVCGVEENAASAATAKSNYRNFGAENITFYTGDADRLLPEAISSASTGAAILFDPPRGGMSGRSIRTLIDSKLQNAVYVSCHPATLIRDLSRIRQGGFKISKVRMIDMFPRSSHFETFVQLSR